MFRHPEGEQQPQQTGQPEEKKAEIETPIAAQPAKDSSPSALRELLEKNLKWSQIIYEQNRKINNKLLWSAIAEWLRLFIIVIPLVVLIWGTWAFLPQLKNVYSQYNELLGLNAAANGKNGSCADLIKNLPVSAAQQEQLKGMLCK